MHSRIVLLVTLLLLVPLLLPGVMWAAGDAPLDRATLRGLGSVSIIIDPIADELVREGLTRDVVQKRIEARLHDAGIGLDPSAPQFVGIRVLQVRNQRGPYALCVSVGVYQPVMLLRNKDVKTATETWGVETILMADPKVVNREALNSVDELADRLVAAYRAVNPKSTP
jgi:hypothetical protein